jgi:hypothetical protein
MIQYLEAEQCSQMSDLEQRYRIDYLANPNHPLNVTGPRS